jgi:uncharacterized protein YlxP (DUF503 family)
VSVAEVDAQDMYQSAVLLVAQAASDSRYARASLDQVVEHVRRQRDSQLGDYRIELLYP